MSAAKAANCHDTTATTNDYSRQPYLYIFHVHRHSVCLFSLSVAFCLLFAAPPAISHESKRRNRDDGEVYGKDESSQKRRRRLRHDGDVYGKDESMPRRKRRNF